MKCVEFPFAGPSVVNDYQASREIAVTGRPDKVTLVIEINPQAGYDLGPIALRPGQDMEFDDSQKEYRLVVPVQWKDVGHGIVAPHTRQKGVDNVDVVFLSKKGGVLDYQVALVTRGGKFYATVQKQFKGQVVRTTGPRPGTRNIDVMPLEPVNAYPGNSGYDKTWERMGALLKKMVIEGDMPGQQKSRAAQAAEWTEPKFKADEKGWESMVVLYHNLVTGFGKLMDREGRPYQFRSDLIVDVPKGTLPMLEPGTLVWARKTSEPGAADAIKSIKVDTDQ
jgi:hypothetical protein